MSRSSTWSQSAFTSTTALTEGLHSLQASAVNAAGKTGQKNWSFTTDTQIPTVTLTVAPASGRNLSLAWSGSDPNPSSGGLSYEVQYKLVTSPTFTSWLTSVSYTSTTFPVDAGLYLYFPGAGARPGRESKQLGEPHA